MDFHSGIQVSARAADKYTAETIFGVLAETITSGDEDSEDCPCFPGFQLSLKDEVKYTV